MKGECSQSNGVAQARALLDAGRIAEAEQQLIGLLSEESANPEVLLLAGVAAARANRLTEASEHLEAVLRMEPDRPDALIWLANAKKLQGEPQASVDLLNRVASNQTPDASTLTLLGLCHLDLGHPQNAIECFERVVQMEPSAAQAHFNLGMAYRLRNRNREALDAFLLALKYGPERSENYLQVFKQYQQMSLWDKGIETLEKGLKRHPTSPRLSEALATAYGRLNQPEKAEPIFRSVAERDPVAAVAFAKWLQELGRFEESIDVLNRCTLAYPSFGAAYRELAEAKIFDLPDGHLIDRTVRVANAPDKDRMHLAYALGMAHEADGRFQEAIANYDEANDLAYRLYPVTRTFDIAGAQEDPEIMSQVYTAELIERMGKFGSESEKPIFIVGMVRSGTTLLDQIVSSHPSVASAGEQPFWNAEADNVHRKWRQNPSPADLLPLAESYLQVLEQAAPGAERTTDKMPLNFRHLGLIAAAFPNAKILHIRRDPLDTCLSIYTTFFAGGPNFAYRKPNIVAFYRSYLRMMEHWRSALDPSRFMEIDYETLVADPDSNARRVIEFCRLSWDDSCLKFHQSKAAISTPSRWQARQPIYRSSIGRSKRFEPWLGELLDLRDGGR